MADARAGAAVLPSAQHIAHMRYPVLGAALQRRGGTARHDAVAWGYARAGDALGVDILQNCEVTAIQRDADGAVCGVETSRGTIRTRKIGVVRGRHTSVVMAMAGLRMPLESYPLQALVTEPVKPCFPCVVMSKPSRLHQPVRQGRTGDRRRHRCLHLLYAARRAAHRRRTRWTRSASCSPSSAACACCATGPASSTSRPTVAHHRARPRCRASTSTAAGAPGGFKATPGPPHLFASTIARDEPHAINAPFTLERFRDGRLIDEAAAAAVAH